MKMTGVVKARSLREDGTDVRTNLDAVLRDYGQATEAFAHDLRQRLSDYDLMVVKQRYLLAAAAKVKSISEIFDYQNLYPAASYFEAAAWAYLDNSDLRAYQQGLDNRFTLNEESSRFLRSRLKVMAERAIRIGELYRKDLRDATNFERSSLKFLLELVLELPIGAWECAPCHAVTGNCKNCGYGRDHGICSHPGSTYEMLSGSREAILNRIRRWLTETGRRSGTGILLQEQNMHFEFSDKSPSIQMEIDICGEYDIVELCD
jgi:hypothetical protein